MLKKISWQNLVFLNIHHTKKIIDIYINELNKIFKVISQKINHKSNHLERSNL